MICLTILCIAQWIFIGFLLRYLIPGWRKEKKENILRKAINASRKKPRGRPSGTDLLKIETEVARRMQEEAEKKEEELPGSVVPY